MKLREIIFLGLRKQQCFTAFNLKRVFLLFTQTTASSASCQVFVLTRFPQFSANACQSSQKEMRLKKLRIFEEKSRKLTEIRF